MRKAWLIAAAMAAALPAAAHAESDEQLWVNLTAQGTVKDDIVYFVEVQPRIGDGVSRLSQLLLRSAIGVKVSPSVTLYQGYAHVALPVAGGRDRNEERSFQQASWSIGKGSAGDLSSRTRMEQRWLSNGSDTGWRLRQMIRYKLPLATQQKGVAFLTSAEGFWALNSTDWGARSGFDQVRLFGGAEIPLMGASTVEAGYLAQVANQASGPSRVAHVASLSIFLRP